MAIQKRNCAKNLRLFRCRMVTVANGHLAMVVVLMQLQLAVCGVTSGVMESGGVVSTYMC